MTASRRKRAPRPKTVPVQRLLPQFPKEEINNLPLAAFEGRIVLVETAESAWQAVAWLMRHDSVGIDTETRPSFTRGHNNQVALLQVSTRDVCFLFRLCKMGLPSPLVRLLSDRRLLKVGLSLHDDIHQLQQRCPGLEMGRHVELQQFVRQFGIRDMSLQKIYANVFGGKISKRAQLSNWEAATLDERQRRYAATDAWACLVLYDRLCHLRDTGDWELVTQSNPDQLIEEIIASLIREL